MNKRIVLLLIIICLIGLVTVPVATASSNQPLPKEQVFTLLQEAFQAQSSLTLEFRTYDEVEQILAPYFRKDFAATFLEENLMKEEEGYIVYGSDFALYFVPFYSYTDETKILFDQQENKMYVYELFKAPDSGPVSYKDHYEIITLEKINSNWVISKLAMEDEPPFVKETKSEAVKENEKAKTDTSFLTWNPFKTTIYSLLEMDNRTPLQSGCFNEIF
ncbi:DUF3993 domain-containing protein [Fredinandcohnia sp. QZ13]|uniref:DUF3993 domain-containing protein n=1 Tax=Fredinandcohnia sp. QZ13 TaxID=3073144 RepID=UPI002852FADD|nr:DUF3993 domain-containing protein [Fredinandcohnia sp. QZ13]MDR4886676.1 DUF3993 domain-containing protein [Fredinandcohnia sp. QZ13]